MKTNLKMKEKGINYALFIKLNYYKSYYNLNILQIKKLFIIKLILDLKIS